MKTSECWLPLAAGIVLGAAGVGDPAGVDDKLVQPQPRAQIHAQPPGAGLASARLFCAQPVISPASSTLRARRRRVRRHGSGLRRRTAPPTHNNRQRIQRMDRPFQAGSGAGGRDQPRSTRQPHWRRRHRASAARAFSMGRPAGKARPSARAAGARVTDASEACVRRPRALAPSHTRASKRWMPMSAKPASCRYAAHASSAVANGLGA